MSDYLHTCQLLRIEMRDKEKAEGLGSVVSPPPPQRVQDRAVWV